MGGLASFIIATISLAGYAGLAGLMALESACVPLPSEVIIAVRRLSRFNRQVQPHSRRHRGVRSAAISGRRRPISQPPSAATHWFGAGDRCFWSKPKSSNASGDSSRITERSPSLPAGSCRWFEPLLRVRRDSPGCLNSNSKFIHSWGLGFGAMRWPISAPNSERSGTAIPPCAAGFIDSTRRSSLSCSSPEPG